MPLCFPCRICNGREKKRCRYQWSSVRDPPELPSNVRKNRRASRERRGKAPSNFPVKVHLSQSKKAPGFHILHYSCILASFLHFSDWMSCVVFVWLLVCFSVSCLVSMGQIGSSRTQFSAPWSKVQWFWPGVPCAFWLDWAPTAQFSGMQFFMHSPFSLDLETHWPSSQFTHWKLSSEPNSYVMIF